MWGKGAYKQPASTITMVQQPSRRKVVRNLTRQSLNEWMDEEKDGAQVKNANGKAGSGRRSFSAHLCFTLHKTSSGEESNLSKWYRAIVCLSVSLLELIHSLELTTRNGKKSVRLGRCCKLILSLCIYRKYVHFPVARNVSYTSAFTWNMHIFIYSAHLSSSICVLLSSFSALSVRLFPLFSHHYNAVDAIHFVYYIIA